MRIPHDGEDVGRYYGRVGMWAAWTGAVTLTGLRVAGALPQHYAVLVLVLIGIAITLGQAQVRAKLSDSIVGAFETGMRESERARMEAVQEVVEVVEEDRKARVVTSDQAQKMTDSVLAVVIDNHEALKRVERDINRRSAT